MTRTEFHNGCTCGVPNAMPPCSFCTEMDEDETEAYCSGGMQALIPFIGRMRNDVYTLILEKAYEGQD